MSKFHYIAIGAALPAAALLAWRMGDTRGVGLAVGVSVAVAISLGGMFAQDRASSALSSGGRPARGLASVSFMAAFAVTFLVKLFALATGAVVLRLHAGLAALADWRAYLVGFAAAVAWTLLVSAFRRSNVAPARKEAPASC